MSRYDGDGFRSLSSARLPILSSLSGMVQTARGETWLQNARSVIRMRTADLEHAFDDAHFSPRYQSYDFNDGLPGVSAYFNSSTVTEDPQGRIWVATNNGFAWTNPRAMPHNSALPPMAITRIAADNRTIRLGDSVTLPAGTIRMEIRFAGLSLSLPARNRFRYRLSGVDKYWIDGGTDQRAIYTNLAPGRYVFDVQGSNNDGLWNSAGTRVGIRLPATFLQSHLFITLCGLTVVALGWVVYRLRLHAVAQRLRARHEARLGERERIARELHDTLLQSVQGLLLQFQSAADGLPRHAASKTALDGALDQAERLIIEARDRVSDLRRDTLTTRLETLFANVARRSSVEEGSRVSIDIAGRPRLLTAIATDEISAIVGEALFNIAQHARAEAVAIRATFDDALLTIAVEDDGVGIPENVLARGFRDGHFGLVGIQERARRIAASLMVQRGSSRGTVVTLVIPGSIAYGKQRTRTARIVESAVARLHSTRRAIRLRK